MSDENIKKDILQFLAGVRKKHGPEKESDLTCFADEMGINIDEFNHPLAELYDSFFVELHSIPGYLSASITSDGVDYLAQSNESF